MNIYKLDDTGRWILHIDRSRNTMQYDDRGQAERVARELSEKGWDEVRVCMGTPGAYLARFTVDPPLDLDWL